MPDILISAEAKTKNKERPCPPGARGLMRETDALSTYVIYSNVVAVCRACAQSGSTSLTILTVKNWKQPRSPFNKDMDRTTQSDMEPLAMCDYWNA